MYPKLLVLLVATLTGCATTVPKDPMVYLPVSDPTIVEGARYELEVKSDDRSKVSYIGEVREANDEYVVFDGAIKRAEVESSLPLPLIGKYFQNKAIGMKEIDKKIRIRRDQILSVNPLDEGSEQQIQSLAVEEKETGI